MIPAHPLALTERGTLDERRQRALTRYYLAAGAGGVAVGVHTTQFAIRDPQVGLFEPVLQLAAETVTASEPSDAPVIRIAGICGPTRQAVAEAEIAAGLGYHAGLVSLAGWTTASDGEMVAHLRSVAETIPVMGFYLQPAVGGRPLSFEFWCRVLEIEEIVAIKAAPFDRYQTADVARAIATTARAGDVALYTGNDDHIVFDLLTTYRFGVGDSEVPVVGGFLGHWAYWTKRAVEYHAACRRVAATGEPVPTALLDLATQITGANAAIFDAPNRFAGCIPGIHEVLWRDGLLAERRCLDPDASLSAGQPEAIDRVLAAYPQLTDREFVRAHLDDWLT